MKQNKQKVLVVDDNEDIVLLVSNILKREGYLVLKALDMPSAMDVIYKERPDLLVLDLILPRGSGIGICKKVRQDKRYANIPIIILTAKPEREYEAECRALGVKEYINKPFDPADFVRIVKHNLLVTKEENRINKILIVDDYPAVVESVKMLLEDINNLEFETARNSVEAWTKINTTVPDLIILDAEMPGGNGDELVRKMKNDENLKNVKILGYTGIPTEGRFLEQMGVDKVIIKSSKEGEMENFQREVKSLLSN